MPKDPEVLIIASVHSKSREAGQTDPSLVRGLIVKLRWHKVPTFGQLADEDLKPFLRLSRRRPSVMLVRSASQQVLGNYESRILTMEAIYSYWICRYSLTRRYFSAVSFGTKTGFS